MFRTISVFVTMIFVVSVANAGEMSTLAGIDAEPLTEGQMDQVTARFTVNGNDIATITFINEDPDQGAETITILAGGSNATLPVQVHDNNSGEGQLFVGAGQWSAGLALARVGNTKPPIVHF